MRRGVAGVHVCGGLEVALESQILALQVGELQDGGRLATALQVGELEEGRGNGATEQGKKGRFGSPV